MTRSATSSQCSSEWSRCVKPRSYFFVPLKTRAATRTSYHTIPSLLGQKFSKSLPPTTEEVNAIAHDVCLSVSKITLKRVHVFRWHFACRQVWRHGQTDQVLNPIRIIVRMPEPDCVCTATRQRGILLRRENSTYWYWAPVEATTRGFKRHVVLRRRNTVVGGKGALPNALLVIIWLYLVVQLYKWFPAVILEKGVEIPEVFLASYRLAIFRKSHQSTSHNLKRFRSISEKPGWGGGRLAPSHL